MKIVLASKNKHKVQEINDIVNCMNLDLEFVLPPDDFNPVENGKTFEENSFIKAKEAWNYSKNWVLADDSGLCIDALDGKPGIYSARYADTQELKIKKILKEMQNIQNRNAHFTCAMTLINPKGDVEYKFQGICEGYIIKEARGSNGFGYDPIFLVKNDTRTMAELSEFEKNKVSHRSIALNHVLEYLKSCVISHVEE